MNFELRPPPVKKRWDGTVIVAAPGPSLTKEAAGACKGHRVIAVQDAWRLFPFAEVMYGCDAKWWEHHEGTKFKGEKWSSHSLPNNDKRQQFLKYRLHVVAGQKGDGFSLDPKFIHYGDNSGFQAVNLAILFGASRIVLVGFDMRVVNDKRHFFGDHPEGFVKSSDYQQFIRAFEKAPAPKGVEIVNCTPGSALTCYPKMKLERAISRVSSCIRREADLAIPR